MLSRFRKTTPSPRVPFLPLQREGDELAAGSPPEHGPAGNGLALGFPSSSFCGLLSATVQNDCCAATEALTYFASVSFACVALGGLPFQPRKRQKQRGTLEAWWSSTGALALKVLKAREENLCEFNLSVQAEWDPLRTQGKEDWSSCTLVAVKEKFLVTGPQYANRERNWCVLSTYTFAESQRREPLLC